MLHNLRGWRKEWFAAASLSREKELGVTSSLRKMLLLGVLEKIEQLPIEGKVYEKHLCSFSSDHLISSDSFCLPEGDSSHACLCGLAPPRLPVAGAQGDRLKFPEKDRHCLLLRGASSKGWHSTGSIGSVECVEGGRKGTHESSKR